MATIRDVAKLAGVSPTTVSHVINGTRFVREETRARVLEAMRRLNYQPNRLARSLRQKRTHTLGLLIPNSANPFFAEVLRGIEDACFEMGYSVILCNADDDPEKELEYLSVLVEKQVDGIVLVSAGAADESLRLLTASRVPAVVVDREFASQGFDTVVTDNQGGGYAATRHLLSLGHRRIGCITGPSLLTPSAARVTGYRQALEEAGVPFDEELVVPGDFRSESGYEMTRKLLGLPEPPTAIFACNDMMALGAICAVHEAGLRVPDDVSVVGFDDITLASYSVPRLTTIAQPRHKMGFMAARMLIERISNRDAPIKRELLPTTLIVRDSCARLEH